MSSLPIIFVVDDDASWCRALQRLLRTRPWEVRTFGSAMEFLAEHDQEAAGCIILDFTLPEMDGLEVQESLCAMGCQRPIVFVSGLGSIPATVRAMRAGALNFLPKPVDDWQLLRALDEALEIDAEQRRASSVRSTIARRLAKLTPREREVLEHVVAGRLNKQIAGDLGTVEKTVKVHRARVMRKLGVRSLAELVRLTAAPDDTAIAGVASPWRASAASVSPPLSVGRMNVRHTECQEEPGRSWDHAGRAGYSRT